MTPYLQVMTTASSSEEAQRIGRELVERRLAGCVQIVGPITSIYEWQGAIETAAEWQCLVKTRHDRYDQVEQTIRELHCYDTPEILALPIAAGDVRYLRWLDEWLGAGD